MYYLTLFFVNLVFVCYKDHNNLYLCIYLDNNNFILIIINIRVVKIRLFQQQLSINKFFYADFSSYFFFVNIVFNRVFLFALPLFEFFREKPNDKKGFS